MTPGKGTPIRTVRIADDVWQRAQRQAAREETTVSDAMRSAVEELAKKGRGKGSGAPPRVRTPLAPRSATPPPAGDD